MTERIHIAGFPVRVGTKARQLCAWCGERLVDDDLSCMAVAPNADGSPQELNPDFWAIGTLVAVYGACKWIVRDTGGPLPLRCCASQRKLGLVRAVETEP